MNIPTLTDMITHLAGEMPAVMRMLTAFCYVMGLFFMYSGVYHLKQYGDLRTMTSANTDLKGPIVKLALGAAFLYFPSTISTGMETLFATSSPLAYSSGGDQTETLIISAVIKVMQVIGVIAVIRGLLFLSKAGNQGQPGMAGRGITHLIAGILAINIYGTWQVLENSLGFAVQ